MPLKSSVISSMRTGAAAFVCVTALLGAPSTAFAEAALAEPIASPSDALSASEPGSGTGALADGEAPVPAEGLDSEASVADGGDGPEADPVDGSDTAMEGVEASASTMSLAPELEEADSQASVSAGWHREGDGYVYYRADGTKATGWLVVAERPDGGTGGLERYWLHADGSLATNELIRAADGSYGYAKPDGTIVRGRWTDSSTGYVYLADNDGRLEGPGWVITDAYGQGLQRYWIDSESHACEPGSSSEGWSHLTMDGGYVLRGAGYDDAGNKVYADNDGRLFQSGWLVTGDYTSGDLQRYWFEDGRAVTNALIPASKAGWKAYATGTGAVVRGKWTDPSTGYVYLANNDGKLESSGWVVTGAYSGGSLERYWVDDKSGACVPGRSSDGWGHYTLPSGAVLRGASVIDGERLYADNDGRLVTDGWVVTDGWGQGLQRYWLQGGSVVSGELVNTGATGYAYAKDDGTILRGKLALDGVMLLADNDGRLAWGKQDWLVTGSYDGGVLQRYYLTRSTSGKYYGARLGRFSVGDFDYYGREDTGYVVRGEYTTPSGTLLFADNDGVLGNRIMGVSQNTVDQMVSYYNAQHKAYPSEALGRGGAPDIRTFCTIICEEAAAEGVRAEIVFTQAMLETGWLQFGGDVKIDQFNFAGIGATGGGVPGNSFPDVRTGIRAQVQHLKAYASTDPLNNACVDPRFNYVKRGSAPTMEQLAGKWAASTGYGESLRTILSGLSRY